MYCLWPLFGIFSTFFILLNLTALFRLSSFHSEFICFALMSWMLCLKWLALLLMCSPSPFPLHSFAPLLSLTTMHSFVLLKHPTTPVAPSSAFSHCPYLHPSVHHHAFKTIPPFLTMCPPQTVNPQPHPISPQPLIAMEGKLVFVCPSSP